MPTITYFVLCARAILDQFSQIASCIDVMEIIPAIPTTGPFPEGREEEFKDVRFSVPPLNALIHLWARDDEKGKPYSILITITAPDGKEVPFIHPLTWEQTQPGQRLYITTLPIGLRMPGVYALKLKLKSGEDDWVNVREMILPAVNFRDIEAQAKAPASAAEKPQSVL